MSFGLRQLEAMGWTEGTGLGLKQNGIKTAIKPKLKFDNNGIGFEANESSNQWWNQSFNFSANYIDFKLSQTQNGIKLKHKSSDERNKKNKSKKYSNFVNSCETESEIKKSVESHGLDPKISETLNFDEVFRQSGGLTGHKGGRHGIKMSAKLKRIEEQNNEFMKTFKKIKSNKI